MKVLQINAIYGTKSTGTIVKEIQNRSLECGIDAYVAYSLSPIHKKNVINGYKIGSYISKKLHAFLSRIAGKQAYFSTIATWRFMHWIKEINPDVVHLHNLHSNYININRLLYYLAVNNIPTIITMHDCWYFTGGCFHYCSVKCSRWKDQCGNCPKKYMDTPAYLYDASAKILKDRVEYLSKIPRLTFVGCSKWIVSQLRQSRLADVGQKLCIYNGFDLDVFKPIETNLKEKLGLDGKVVVLGPASKWLMQDNRDALRYFIMNMPNNMVLLLFGYSGPQIQISNNVKLYAYTTSQREMAELYSMADVLVNCSREDTLSSLNIEVQACGTPVVTYDATGSKETVDGISGYAVQTGDYEALFNGTLKVISITSSGIGLNCREFVKRKFEKNTNYQLYVDLYKQMLN